ncbi:unnamed protein product [Hermetia illucens]|uniref:PPM-type phosphatase domain-containing protein n=1 Tax=Hermetia illucens TaxID=343691 RepID=A0A7R8UFU4_HERIL|nr:TGF-beta-activated kinase 1 and MAP3K7-binding protein 1-like [Hermetia illucens]CAD7079252.1 unnamed protein product [Hermetia illucens]
MIDREDSNHSTQTFTDDIPLCNKSAVAEATNKNYRDKSTVFGSLDRSMNYAYDYETSLYGIFSGQNGVSVAERTRESMIISLFFGQVKESKTPDEVKDVLRKAFIDAENRNQEEVDGRLAKRMVLYDKVNDKNITYEEFQKYQKEISEINAELLVGSSVILCLIHNTKMYICNIGTCRALLCKYDENNAPRVVQFSDDHNLDNPEEIMRLSRLGLDRDALAQSKLQITRCMGCYAYKGGYKDCELYAKLASEPVISTPEIVEGQQIDGSFQFLLLLSAGLCNALRDIYPNDVSQQNREIIRITAKEFERQSSIQAVAKAVVNKIVDLHHQVYVEGTRNIVGIDDLTLLVRRFNVEMPNISVSGSQDTIVPNSMTENTFTNTTSSIYSRKPGKIESVDPYICFDSYYEKVAAARASGTLPEGIDFD